MHHVTRHQLLSLTTAFTLGVATLAAAQAPAPASPPAQPSAQSEPTSPLQGELLAIDTEAKTIEVMGANDMKHFFTYTDATVVTGAETGIAGLSNMKNARVTVHFTEAAGKRMASRIDVRAVTAQHPAAPPPAQPDPQPRPDTQPR